VYEIIAAPLCCCYAMAKKKKESFSLSVKAQLQMAGQVLRAKKRVTRCVYRESSENESLFYLFANEYIYLLSASVFVCGWMVYSFHSRRKTRVEN
jgi:SHS2 domain-containing protein